MIRAVIDTNVIVSGLLSPAGNEALILVAVHESLIRPCLSDEILTEYAGVLTRPKFAFPPEEIEALLTMLRGHGELRAADLSAARSPDPGDSKSVLCAHAAQADFLVTKQAPLSRFTLRPHLCRERR